MRKNRFALPIFISATALFALSPVVNAATVIKNTVSSSASSGAGSVSGTVSEGTARASVHIETTVNGTVTERIDRTVIAPGGASISVSSGSGSPGAGAAAQAVVTAPNPNMPKTETGVLPGDASRGREKSRTRVSDDSNQKRESKPESAPDRSQRIGSASPASMTASSAAATKPERSRNPLQAVRAFIAYVFRNII